MTSKRLSPRLLPLGTPLPWGRCLPCRRRGLLVGSASFLGILGLLGCNELTGSQPLPAGTSNPSSYNTPAGALSMRATVINTFQEEIPLYITDTGLLTDELESNLVGNVSAGQLIQLTSSFTGQSIDERILPELTTGAGTDADNDYYRLQAVRGDVNQAVGALATYDSAAPSALRGELYALEGYAEILLADFFCSGVPLSTLDYNKDFTYHTSSSTAQVYEDAIAKLDTALTLSSDSARILNLARVLKGRALLDLDSLAAAAQAVAVVPPGFQYQLAIQWNPGNLTNNLLNHEATVSDLEGMTGLPYVSSNDPRTQTTLNTDILDGTDGTAELRFPAKYNQNGFSPFTVADGIEAQLIIAEAQLQPASAPSGPWLATLNALRATVGLSDTTDPGTDTARVSLLFHERAYWLFLTGHRQGDLRRLIRQYGQLKFGEAQVYPVGVYAAPGTGFYGSDVTAPIPSTEYVNPLFHGCMSHGA